MPVKFDSILWIIHLNKVIVYTVRVLMFKLNHYGNWTGRKFRGNSFKTGNYAYNEQGYGCHSLA
jgi:hypothetical protein